MKRKRLSLQKVQNPFALVSAFQREEEEVFVCCDSSSIGVVCEGVECVLVRWGRGGWEVVGVSVLSRSEQLSPHSSGCGVDVEMISLPATRLSS